MWCVSRCRIVYAFERLRTKIIGGAIDSRPSVCERNVAVQRWTKVRVYGARGYSSASFDRPTAAVASIMLVRRRPGFGRENHDVDLSDPCCLCGGSTAPDSE